MILKYVLTVLGIVGFGYLFSVLQGYFAPETLANGFMDIQKGKEIAPTVFKKKEKKE